MQIKLSKEKINTNMKTGRTILLAGLFLITVQLHAQSSTDGTRQQKSGHEHHGRHGSHDKNHDGRHHRSLNLFHKFHHKHHGGKESHSLRHERRHNTETSTETK